jgi:hypothetical protein
MLGIKSRCSLPLIYTLSPYSKFLTALLKNNPYSITFTHAVCIIKWLWAYFQSCVAITAKYPISVAMLPISPQLSYPQAQASINLFTMYVDEHILEISNSQDNTRCGLWLPSCNTMFSWYSIYQCFIPLCG